jgi:predicted nucleotidyltransferase
MNFILKMSIRTFTIMNVIDMHMVGIKELCLKHKVKNLFAFGSVIKDTFNKDSDVDLVVDFENLDMYEYANNYFSLKEQLENLFGRPVDLLEEKGIRNPMFRSQINKDKKLIYES